MDANGSCYIITYLWSTPVYCPLAQPTSRAAWLPYLPLRACPLYCTSAWSKNFFIQPRRQLCSQGRRNQGGRGANPFLLKRTSLTYYYSPTTFFNLPPFLSCVLFSLVTHVQSRTSFQYIIAAVVVVYEVTVVATKLYAKTKKSRVKVGNEDVLAEFFTPRKHENNVVLTHFLFQIPYFRSPALPCASRSTSGETHFPPPLSKVCKNQIALFSFKMVSSRFLQNTTFIPVILLELSSFHYCK